MFHTCESELTSPVVSTPSDTGETTTTRDTNNNQDGGGGVEGGYEQIQWERMDGSQEDAASPNNQRGQCSIKPHDASIIGDSESVSPRNQQAYNAGQRERNERRVLYSQCWCLQYDRQYIEDAFLTYGLRNSGHRFLVFCVVCIVAPATRLAAGNTPDVIWAVCIGCIVCFIPCGMLGLYIQTLDKAKLEGKVDNVSAAEELDPTRDLDGAGGLEERSNTLAVVHEALCIFGTLALVVVLAIVYACVQDACSYLQTPFDGRANDEDCPAKLLPFFFFAPLTPFMMGQPRFIAVALIYGVDAIITIGMLRLHSTSVVGTVLLKCFCVLYLFCMLGIKYHDEKEYRRRFVVERELRWKKQELQTRSKNLREFVVSITPPFLQRRLLNDDSTHEVDVSKDAICIVINVFAYNEFLTSMLPLKSAVSIGVFGAQCAGAAAKFKLHYIRAAGDEQFLVSNLFSQDTDTSDEAALNGIKFAQLLRGSHDNIPFRCAVTRGELCGMPLGTQFIRYDIMGQALTEAMSILQFCEKRSYVISPSVAAAAEGCSVFSSPAALQAVTRSHVPRADTLLTDMPRFTPFSPHASIQSDANFELSSGDQLSSNNKNDSQGRIVTTSSTFSGCETVEFHSHSQGLTDASVVVDQNASVVTQRQASSPSVQGGSSNNSLEQLTLTQQSNPLSENSNDDGVMKKVFMAASTEATGEVGTADTNLDLKRVMCFFTKFNNTAVEKEARQYFEKSHGRLFVVVNVAAALLTAGVIILAAGEHRAALVRSSDHLVGRVIFLVVACGTFVLFVALAGRTYLVLRRCRSKATDSHVGSPAVVSIKPEWRHHHHPSELLLAPEINNKLFLLGGILLFIGVNLSRPSIVGDGTGYLLFFFSMCAAKTGANSQQTLLYQAFLLVSYFVLRQYRPLLYDEDIIIAPCCVAIMSATALYNKQNWIMYANMEKDRLAVAKIKRHDAVRDSVMNAMIPRTIRSEVNADTVTRGTIDAWDTDEIVVVTIKVPTNLLEDTTHLRLQERMHNVSATLENLVKSVSNRSLHLVRAVGGCFVIAGPIDTEENCAKSPIERSKGKDGCNPLSCESSAQPSMVQRCSVADAVEDVFELLHNIQNLQSSEPRRDALAESWSTASQKDPLMSAGSQQDPDFTKLLALPVIPTNRSRECLSSASNSLATEPCHVQTSAEVSATTTTRVSVKSHPQQHHNNNENETAVLPPMNIAVAVEQAIHVVKQDAYPSYDVHGPAVSFATSLLHAAPAHMITLSNAFVSIYVNVKQDDEHNTLVLEPRTAAQVAGSPQLVPRDANPHGSPQCMTPPQTSLVHSSASDASPTTISTDRHARDSYEASKDGTNNSHRVLSAIGPEKWRLRHWGSVKVYRVL